MEEKYSLESLIPYVWDFLEDGYIVTEDGRVVYCLEIELVDYLRVSGVYYNSFHNMMLEVINTIPIGTTVHQQLHYGYDCAAKESVTPSHFLTYHKIAHTFVEQAINGRCYLYFSFFADSSVVKFNHLNSWGTRLQPLKNPFKKLEETIPSAQKAITEILRILDSYSFRYTLLSTEQFKLLAIQIFNLNVFEGEGKLDNGLQNHPDRLVVGNQNLSFTYSTSPPPVLTPYVSNENNYPLPLIYPSLHKLSFPHIVNVVVTKLNTDKTLAELERKINYYNSVTKDHVLSGNLRSFVDEVKGSKETVCNFHFNIGVWTDSTSELSFRIQDARKSITDVGGDSVLTPYENLQLFISSLPGMGYQLPYTYVLRRSEAACFFTGSGDQVGSKEGFYISSLSKKILKVDFWDPRLPAKNKLVIGPTGSGKSFFMNYLFLEEVLNGDEVVIIDNGGSYEKTTSLFSNTKYLDGNSLYFNPFQEDSEEYSAHKVLLLTSLISLLTGSQFSTTQANILAELLTCFSKDTKLRSIEAFYHFVQGVDIDKVVEGASKYFDKQELLINLKKYTGSGQYASLLNATNPASIEANPIVVIDMRGIASDKQLYSVVGLLLIDLIFGKVHSKGRRNRLHIKFDEAWQLFKDPNISNLIEELYRTIRKFEGSVSVITQSINDVLGTSISSALITNSAIKVILNHAEAAHEVANLQTAFSLTNAEVSLIKGLKSRGSDGNEFFVQMGSIFSTVFLLSVSDTVLALFASDKTSMDKHRVAMNQYGDPESAIKEVLELEVDV